MTTESEAYGTFLILTLDSLWSELPLLSQLVLLNCPARRLPGLSRLILAAAKHTQILVVSHAQPLIEELTGSPVCTRLHLVKDFGETKLEDGTVFDRPKWNWPAR